MRRLANMLLILLVTLGGQVQADVIIGNYPPANDSTFVDMVTGNSTGAGFTMPAGSAYSLSSVTLRLFSQATATAKVELFGSSGGNPVGPALDTFTAPAIPVGSFGDVTVTPTSPFTLQPGTTYWMVLTALTGELAWAGSVPGIIPTGIATSAGYRSGTSDPPQTPLDSAFQPSYQIVGSIVPGAAPVPEPASLLSLGLGLAVGGLAPSMRRCRVVPR